jgi:hypothetical protein
VPDRLEGSTNTAITLQRVGRVLIWYLSGYVCMMGPALVVIAQHNTLDSRGYRAVWRQSFHDL